MKARDAFTVSVRERGASIILEVDPQSIIGSPSTSVAAVARRSEHHPIRAYRYYVLGGCRGMRGMGRRDGKAGKAEVDWTLRLAWSGVGEWRRAVWLYSFPHVPSPDGAGRAP